MEALSYRLLDAAKSTTIGEFLQHSRRRSKKTAQSWRVSGGLSALPDEPAQTKNAAKKPNRKVNLKKQNNENNGNKTNENKNSCSSGGNCPNNHHRVDPRHTDRYR
jgi:hypothetical protein